MKYIDADKLKAELYKRIGKYDSMLHEWSIPVVQGKREEAFALLILVESLQQEQPKVDLEKEITAEWDVIDPDLLLFEEFRDICYSFYELGLNARR